MKKGSKYNEETRKKISEAKKRYYENGGIPWNKGKPFIQMIGNQNGFKKGQIPWNKGKEWNAQIKLKMRNAKLGTKRTMEARMKASQTMKGKHTETKNPNWKGNNVGYSALHAWIRRKLGKPSICEYCGTIGLNGRKIHWANKSGIYKRESSDWIRLCVPCHKAFDIKRTNITIKPK